MSKYVPTGRPPGRPSNEAKQAAQALAARSVPTLLKDTTVDRASRPMDAICPECFPNGWTETRTACGCPHGTWVRRA